MSVEEHPSFPYDRLVPARPLRIVFMGTPAFAVPSLQALLDSPHEVVAVYTQPDKPQGRGRKLQAPPVKQLAEKEKIPVYQPQKMTTAEALARFQSDAPDLAVVVAYGKILRASILAIPPLGCINCHASLLPYYRGAAPIQWAIAKGEQETGITTMLLDEGMDTGAMLLRTTTPIHPSDTGGTLHDRLATLSAQTLLATLEALCAGTLRMTPQDHARATHAPMIQKSDLWIDFSRPAREIRDWVRALDPAPGARCLDAGGELWKLFAPLEIVEGVQGQAGEILAVEKDAIVIACGRDALRLYEAQREGRRRLPMQAILAASPLAIGSIFSAPQDDQSDEESEDHA